MAKYKRHPVEPEILDALQALGGTASRDNIKAQMVDDETNSLTYSDVFEKIESAKGNKVASRILCKRNAFVHIICI